MPDFIPVNYSLEITVQALSVTGKKAYNVIHAKTATAHPTMADCLNAVDVMTTWLHDDYSALYSDKWATVSVRARSNAEEPGPVAFNTTMNNAGILNGDRLPDAQALRVNTHTGYTGQSQHGAFFCFPADESVQTNGLYHATYRGSAENILESLRLGLVAVDLVLAIESRAHLALYPILAFEAKAIPATLRSRRPDRGI